MEISSKSEYDGSQKIKRLKLNEKYIPYKLIEDSISQTDLKKETVEEYSTNLFYETLSGKGKLFLKSGLLYYGPVKYGILTCEDTNEQCEIKFPDGTIYVGEIKNNEITGSGKYYFPTGTTYSGELLNGLRHGFGTFESPSEEINYEGNWKNGLKNGYGVMKKKGCTYEGNWKDGFIDGKGKLTWKSGNIYKGEFSKGKIDGDGFMIWFNENKKYSGHWEKNVQNGYGVQIWYETKGEHKFLFNRYIGEWKDGKRNGYGIFYYSNGAKYEGTWKNDNKDGFGIFTFNEGRKFVGLFKEDHFCGNEQNQITESIILKYINDYKEKITKPDKVKKKFTKKQTNDFGSKGANKPSLSSGAKKSISNSINPNIINKNIGKNEIASIEKKESELIPKVQNPLTSNSNVKRNSIKDANNLRITNKIVDFEKFHFNYKVIEEKKEKDVPKTKYNKSLNKFIPFLQFQNISVIQPDIIGYKKEVENIILQNLTEIRRWYQYSNRLVLESEENRLKREEQIYSPQECPYTNKVYLCMELKDLWRIFRDSGIMAAPFSLSCFDRIFYNDSYNITDVIFIDKNSNEEESIYKEMYDKLNCSKYNFAFKNQAFILYYFLTENSEMSKYLYDIINDDKIGKNNHNINIIHEYNEEESKNENSNQSNNNKNINNLENNQSENNINDLFDKNDELLSEKDLKYLKSNKFNFDINNSRNPLLLYQFYNSLFYASILYFSYNKNDLNGCEKFKRIINFINSSKPNFKRGGSKNKTGMSKLESSFMNKANEALNEAQRIRNYDYLLIDEFYRDYSIKLIPIFEKLFLLSKHGKFYNKNDKTIEYSYFYYHILKKIKILSDIFYNKEAYSEIISHFHSSIIENTKDNNATKNNLYSTKNDIKNTKKDIPLTKTEIKKDDNNFNKLVNNLLNKNNNENNDKNEKNEKNDNNDKSAENDSLIDDLKTIMDPEGINEDNCIKYKQIEDLFYTEMNFYEFIELIFFICRKYYLKQNPNAVFVELQVPRKEKTKEKQKEKQNMKQKEKETFMEVINLIYQEVNEFEKKSKENIRRGKFVYKYPELKSHLMKKELIKNAEKMKELIKLKEKEIQRYTLERKNLAEEDKNEYIEEQPEENDDSSEDSFA